jgi:hypothetical protein
MLPILKQPWQGGQAITGKTIPRHQAKNQPSRKNQQPHEMFHY